MTFDYNLRRREVRKFTKQQTWNMNWLTHAIVNVMTREEYAKRFPPPYPFDNEPEGESNDGQLPDGSKQRIGSEGKGSDAQPDYWREHRPQDRIAAG